jgi:YesN/AraC family two-component response regulator
MDVLIIDDQISVLKGIINGVNFNKLGIDHVFTATNVSDAKEIIVTNDINIMLSDIEMPGENGLSLNKWVFEHHPSIIRILLTSHASFQYAQESIKLGCFDYIIQPAPYFEIEDVISRAISKIISDRMKSHYYNVEAIGNVVYNLYSSNPANKEQSVSALNQVGYALRDESNVQSIIVDIYPYSKSASYTLSDMSIFSTLLELANKSFRLPDIYSLVCINRFKQFVLLLFCNSNSLETLNITDFKSFYDGICEEMGFSISCYVTARDKFITIHDTTYACHVFLQNNVAKKPGLYFTDSDTSYSEVTSLSESIAKWTRLLDNNQFELLKENIFSFINYNTSVGRFNLKSLCDFHQSLTKILFVFSYNRNTNIMSLFTDDYNYKDYMSSFEDIESLKEGISFIIAAISKASVEEDSKDNVKRAIDFILANISNDISVKEVADYVHFSPEYFSKLFKKEMGENVKNYMLRIKVDAAKDLLENPNIPVNMVAAELGYSNFSHFTQMFKKHENVTPTEYRKQVLQRMEESK